MKTKIFELPYIGYSSVAGIDLLYTAAGDFSVIMQIENPVTFLCADEPGYLNYHELLIKVIKIMGEGHLLQKQDVFIKRTYKPAESREYLQQSYDAHFSGRKYHEIKTYLILTRQVDRGRFYVFDAKSLSTFSRTVFKILDLLKESGLNPALLNKGQMDRYIGQCLAMDFSSQQVARENISARDNQIDIGKQSVRCLSLIDCDRMDLPGSIAAYQLKNDGKGMREFAMDNLAFLHQTSGYDCMIYNQVISIPSQRSIISSLTLKQKRHSGIPDPANKLCMEDISSLLSEVARDNQLLIHAHFNIMLCAQASRIDEVSNFIESSLFSIGIIPSKNAYNQLELFRASLPANATTLKGYDMVLLPSQAAVCLMFKEQLQRNEKSDFLIRFTDRMGIPIEIDPADLPMESGRISNRSKFVLGGSGSGKSFFMNSLVEQYLLYNMDVVIVDTGHSYSGLCAYYQGKYLTYSEQKPITMNPFAFSIDEYNIEKRDFLKTLVFLLLKGPQGEVSTVEDTVISGVISSFYTDHFASNDNSAQLNFDVFYHYSVARIESICQEDHISFDYVSYRFVLKKFCLGQEFGELLNLSTDASLLEEKLVVFEIDSIREHKVLFPIVTLIIMDVFLQKMRLRHHQRKALILEEAWVRREVA